MNCRSYQEELSRCLDGRLQSHARARVMGHVASCSGCARFWEELKAAQGLVLRLPQAKVGSRFRDDVWRRIQSGEGAPDAIAQEPVPVFTKVRYGLLGAAAAAVFILAVHYGTGNGGTIQEPPEVDRVATGTPDQTNSSVMSTVAPDPFVAPTVGELNPVNLAATAAEQVSQAARSLRNRSKNLTNISDFQPEVLQEVRQDLQTVQSGLVVLKELQQGGFGIELRDDDARDCLTRVLTTLEMSPELEQPEQVMRVLSAVTGCSLDRLAKNLRFSMESARLNERFLLKLRQWEAQRHQLLRHMLIVPVPTGQPGELQFQMLRIEPQHMPPQEPRKKDAPGGLRERSPR